MTALRILAAGIGFLCAFPASTTASVVRVAVQLDSGDEMLGLGVAISDELVLTNASFVDQGSRIFVVHGPSGTRNDAQVRASEALADLALLHVAGLQVDPVTIAQRPPQRYGYVQLKSLGGSSRDGVLEDLFEDQRGQSRYRFIPAPRDFETGIPLMNNCDELLAVGQSARGAGGSSGTSGSLPEMMKFLLESGVSGRTASSPCPTLQDQNTEANQKSEQLQAEKDALSSEVAKLESQIKEGDRKSRAELQALEAKRSELAESLRGKEQELSRQQDEAEEIARKQAELETRNQATEAELDRVRNRESRLETLLIIAGAVAAVSLLLAGIAAIRRRRPREAAEEARAEAILPSRDSGSELPERPQPDANPQPGAAPTLPPTSALGADASDDQGEPRTRVAGWPRSPVHITEARPVGQDSEPTHSPRMSDDPVVGWLVVVAGPGKGSEVVLGSGQNTVGRGKNARVRLDFGDMQIARAAHSIVTYDWKSNRFFLANGKGTNLTYMDSRPVMDPIALELGNEFSIGKTVLRFIPFCDDAFSWKN